MIYGGRIRQAREYCGLTQMELARKVGINQSAIAHIESGRNVPSDELLLWIADQTGFLPDFFEKEPAEDFPLGSLILRARTSLTARELNQAHQYANVLFEHIKKMSRQFNLPATKLPRISEEPIRSAQITRASLGLSPDTPVTNLITTIEKKGVFVLALPIALKKIDAFSTWVELTTERPIVVLSAGKPADRLRFSIAHELGHLVMHQVLRGRMIQLEKEADRFAAEFLLPEKVMLQEIQPPVTLTSIARLKARWGVSMQTLIRRARDLGTITERQYRYLFEQLSTRGWRMKEPDNLNIPEEKPRLVMKMIEELYETSDTIETFARDMSLSKRRAIEVIDEYMDRGKLPLKDYRVTLEEIQVNSRN